MDESTLKLALRDILRYSSDEDLLAEATNLIGSPDPTQDKLLATVQHALRNKEKYPPESILSQEDFRKDVDTEIKYRQFKKIIRAYENLGSIRATAEALGMGYHAVRKALIHCGEYKTKRSEMIVEMYNAGKSVEEIQQATNLSPTTIATYLPFVRGPYPKWISRSKKYD